MLPGGLCGRGYRLTSVWFCKPSRRGKVSNENVDDRHDVMMTVLLGPFFAPEVELAVRSSKAPVHPPPTDPPPPESAFPTRGARPTDPPRRRRGGKIFANPRPTDPKFLRLASFRALATSDWPTDRPSDTLDRCSGATTGPRPTDPPRGPGGDAETDLNFAPPILRYLSSGSTHS